MGYCRGGNKLLIVSVIMGKVFKCSTMITGQPLNIGYDSHTSPDGNEWVIFDEAQILPCYIVEFQMNSYNTGYDGSQDDY